ncbi:MAG TPA: hypothetical protein VIN70_00550 [Candidatus Limnocylindria bacterium]|jgi:hypothetical protein
MRSPRVIGLTAVARHVGTATLAGVVAGIVVGGLLGRVVMRVAAFTAGPGLVGAFTANGNRVGEITLAGTAAIVVFVGLSAGLVGGVLYAVIEPWLRRFRPWHGLAYGAGLLVAFGFTVLDPANLDFRRFGSAPLNVAMFAGLFLGFGVVIAWLFDRLRALIARSGTLARGVEALALLALIPGAIATILILLSLTGLADPLFPIVFALSLLIATIARWRALPVPIGYAALATTMMLGAARTISAVPAILAGF